MNMQGCNTIGKPMPAAVEEAPVSTSARWLDRVLNGLTVWGGVLSRDRKLQA